MCDEVTRCDFSESQRHAYNVLVKESEDKLNAYSCLSNSGLSTLQAENIASAVYPTQEANGDLPSIHIENIVYPTQNVIQDRLIDNAYDDIDDNRYEDIDEMFRYLPLEAVSDDVGQPVGHVSLLSQSDSTYSEIDPDYSHSHHTDNIIHAANANGSSVNSNAVSDSEHSVYHDIAPTTDNTYNECNYYSQPTTG